MKKILSYLFLIVLVLLIIYLGFMTKKAFDNLNYQAVKLTSGEVYFGKLHLFPRLKMTDVYYFPYAPVSVKEQDKVSVAENQPLSLSDMTFQPTNTLYLLKEQILWWTDLSSDSQIVKFIKQTKEVR